MFEDERMRERIQDPRLDWSVDIGFEGNRLISLMDHRVPFDPDWWVDTTLDVNRASSLVDPHGHRD